MHIIQSLNFYRCFSIIAIAKIHRVCVPIHESRLIWVPDPKYAREPVYTVLSRIEGLAPRPSHVGIMDQYQFGFAYLAQMITPRACAAGVSDQSCSPLP